MTIKIRLIYSSMNENYHTLRNKNDFQGKKSYV